MMKPWGDGASVAACTAGCDVALTAAAAAGLVSAPMAKVSEAAATPPATMVRNTW